MALAFSGRGGGGGGGTSTLSKATATLTNAQIKALPTTAVSVVAAPGVGKMIVPVHAVLVCNSSGDYGNISPQAALGVDTATLGSPIGGSAGEWLATLYESVSGVTSLLAVGTSSVGVLGPQENYTASFTYGFSAGVDPAVLANVPLTVQVVNSGLGNFTGGNAANTLVVTVLYYVLTVS